MEKLVSEGEYTLSGANQVILDMFEAGFATEVETSAEIKRVMMLVTMLKTPIQPLRQLFIKIC